MSKSMKWMIAGLVVVFGGLLAYNMLRNYFIKSFFAKMSLPAVTVATSTASAHTWQDIIPAIGSIMAVDGVDISAEIAGKVISINFDSGEYVNTNDELIILDSSVDAEDLKNLQAARNLAKLNFDRLNTLAQREAAARSELDKAKAELEQAEAQVAKTQVQIAKKTLKAPFSGKIGIREVNIGQYVTPGEKLVTLQRLDPVYVNFSLAEKEFSRIAVNQQVNVKVDAYPTETFTGVINAINASVNEKTRNILVQATIPNSNRFLLPGMFANVEVVLPSEAQVITLPQTAIAYTLYGNSVFVVKAEGEDEEGNPLYKAYRQYVKTGQQRNNQVVIKEGLQPGDQVVASGQLKVEDGSPVIIDNSITLDMPRSHETLY
jgi:membrane fusion protein (multidrug efflux system)